MLDSGNSADGVSVEATRLTTEGDYTTLFLLHTIVNTLTSIWPLQCFAQYSAPRPPAALGGHKAEVTTLGCVGSCLPTVSYQPQLETYNRN